MTALPTVATNYPTTRADLAGRLTVPVASAREANAAAALGVSPWTAYYLARRGELPVVKLGRRVVVPVSKLLALIDGATED